MRVFIWPYRAVCLKGWCHIGILYAASAVVRDFTRTILLAGDYTLLLSRLIAGFQISITVWLGVSLLKEGTGRTKIFGVLSGDVYHRIRYNGGLLPYWAWSTLDGVFLLTRGGVFCALKKCSPTSARILFDWRRLLDQTGLRIDHPDILVAVWRLAGLAFYCHFAFARRLICAVFACHGCIRRCLVSDGRPGRCICGTCRQEYFSNTVYCRFYHRCNDNLCLAYPRWRLANICRIVAAGLLLWMIMLI